MSTTFGTDCAHPARAALSAVDADVTAMTESLLWTMSDRDLLALRIDQERVLARLQAALLSTTREVDARGAAVATRCAVNSGMAAEPAAHAPGCGEGGGRPGERAGR